MISINDILFATTKLLSNNFEEDVFVDDQAQAFENACFFVQVIPGTSEVSTKETNRRAVLITIDYLQQANKSIVQINDIADRLKKIFSRKLHVQDRYLNIENVEVNLITDEVGYRLNYLVNIGFIDSIYTVKEAHDLIGSVDLNFEGVNSIPTMILALEDGSFLQVGENEILKVN